MVVFLELLLFLVLAVDFDLDLDMKLIVVLGLRLDGCVWVTDTILAKLALFFSTTGGVSSLGK